MSNHQWSNRVFLCKIVSKYQRISLFAIVTIIIASGFLLPDVFATFGSPVAVSSNARVDGGLGKILENNATSGVVATTNGFYMTWTELDVAADDKILFFAKSSDGTTVTTPVQVDATTGDVNREIKDVAIFVDGTTVNILYQLETPTGFGIFNSHSDDDGVSFNAPESIQNWGDTPNIAYDADPLTDLIAVFADDPATGDLDIFISRNNGVTFNVNDNCDRNDVFHPTTVDSQHNLAVKVDGTAIYMVYNAEDKVNLDESIFICISTDQGAGATNPIEISGTGEETGTFETIILVDDFDLTILFSSDNGGTQELSQLRSSNRGGTFSSQETVENATVCDWSNVTGQYASNAGDTIHVMCLGDSNEGIQTAHSHDMGATYTSFTEVNDDPLDITSLPYVVESSGVFVYYTWANQDDVSLSNSNVFAVSQDEGHTFISQVLNNGTQSTSPDIGVFLGEVFYAEQNSGDDIQFFFEAFNVQPELSLTGSSSITLSVGDTYTEQGATCTDTEDASISVTIGGDVVDTSTAGIYTVTYDCTDSGGIEADQITRTVRVELIPIVDLFSIDIFCDNEILGFIGLIPFLEICPIQGIPTGPIDSDLDGLLDSEEDANGNGIVDFALGETDPNDPDTDGDALEDGWEVRGLNGDGSIPPVSGTPDLDLPALGADPLRADVFVEIDFMTGFDPSDNALNDVVTAFANSPFPNPDGSFGIDLHPQEDDEIPFEFDWTFFSNGTWPNYENAKDQFFMTEAQRLDPDNATIREAKSLVYHYSIFIFDGPRGSGIGEIWGNDFVVSLGALQIDENFQAHTFMHELGHNLGFLHGGLMPPDHDNDGFESTIGPTRFFLDGDDLALDNCKPNYLSVMSYTRQNPYFFKVFTGFPLNEDTLDYSRSQLNTLVENSLNEPDGVSQSTPPGLHTVIGSNSSLAQIRQTDEPIDYNFNFNTNDIGVKSNINNVLFLSECSGPLVNQTLLGYNDWGKNNLFFNFSNSEQAADGVHINFVENELTVEEVLITKNLVNNLNATKDSFLTQGNAKQNEGANPVLAMKSSDKFRPVIAFDQTRIEIAAAGETLQSAKLRLHITDNGNNWGPNGRDIVLHSLTQDWEEGNGWNTGNNISGDGSGVTWNCPIDSDISNNQDDCTNQWNGGSFTPASTSTVLITNDMINQFIEFDVTSDVQAFLDVTSSNFGWIIKKGDEALNGSLDFASKESADNQPKLILTFEGQ